MKQLELCRCPPLSVRQLVLHRMRDFHHHQAARAEKRKRQRENRKQPKETKNTMQIHMF